MAKQDNSTLYMILAAAAAGLLLLSKPKPPLPYGMFSGVYKGNTVVITYEGHKYTFTGTTYSAWPINVVVRVTDTSYSIAEDKEGGATIGAAKVARKTKTAADFELGTPANYHTQNDGEQAGEIVIRDGKKTISLYPNKNYGGRERIVYDPDKINWNNMESFTEASKRAGAPFTITNNK